MSHFFQETAVFTLLHLSNIWWRRKTGEKILCTGMDYIRKRCKFSQKSENR